MASPGRRSAMPLKYKVEILEELKAAGATPGVIRMHPERLGFTKPPFSESTIQKFRKNEGVSWENLEMVCRITGKQPGDLIEWIPEK